MSLNNIVPISVVVFLFVFLFYFFMKNLDTVKPVLSKHLRKAKKWLLETGACFIQINIHLLSFYGT